MLIDSEELKKRLLVKAEAEWDGAYDQAIVLVQEMEAETVAENERKLREELALATAPCGDQINHAGTVFTCREKGYHRIHDDHEETDGTPMRWLDTSLGRIKKEGSDV